MLSTKLSRVQSNDKWINWQCIGDELYNWNLTKNVNVN
jgi:hypothetical protein